MGGSFGNNKSHGVPCQIRRDLQILATARLFADLYGKSQLMWITDVGDPRAKRDASTRSLIKKHVMKDIGKSRRRPQRRDFSIRKQVLSSGAEPGRYTFKEVIDDSLDSSPSDEDIDRVVDVLHYPLHNDATRPSLFSRSIATCLKVGAHFR